MAAKGDSEKKPLSGKELDKAIAEKMRSLDLRLRLKSSNQQRQMKYEEYKRENETLLQQETDKRKRREIEWRIQGLEREIKECKERVQRCEEDGINRVVSQLQSLQQMKDEGLAKNREARTLFEEAMQSGYVLCNMVILLLIGVAGSGKTSFLRIVMDKPSPVIRESTPLAQSAIRAVSISRATVSSEGLIWRNVSPGDLLQMLADAIKGKMLFHFATTLPTSPVKPMPRPGVAERIRSWISKPKAAVAKCPDSEHANHLENKPADHAHLLTTKSKPLSSKLAESKPVQEMLSHLEVAELGCKELFSENWVYLVDSGGQPQYHELIPTFIHHVSGAVVFVKLNEDLGSHPTIAYYAQGGKLCGRTYSSPLTHEQTIKNCLQTIQSRLNVTGGHDCPALFFVGTHRDLESTSESIESKDEQLLDIVKSLEGLKPHVVLNRVAKPEKLMSVVNAKDPEAQDHHTVGEFRQAVMKGCRKVELKIPISWFILEQQLQELANNNATLVLSLEECLAVARDLEIDQPRLLAAIDYFVRLNLFKYFPTVLPGVVFTTSQVLLDKISELVMHSHYLHGEPGCEPEPNQIENDINLLRFRDHAIVNAPFLQNFQAHYRYEDGLFTPQELLDILSNQLVFAPFVGEDFFMPCVLPQLPLEKVATFRLPSGSPVPPMLIHYVGGLFPTGLFSSLVAFLQDRSPWKVAEKHSEPICLFKNCVMFKHTDFPITLTLIYSFEFIEIHAKVEPGFSASPYPSIRTTLFLGLDRAAAIQSYDSLHPQIGFLCVCEKDTSHLASVSDDGRWWCCSLDDTCSGALTENQLVWIGDYIDTSTTNDPTLTVTRVSVALKTLVDWHHLGLLLEIEISALDKIRLDFDKYGQTRQCYEMINFWLQSDTQASWHKLCTALEDMDKTALAATIRSKYCA